MATSLSDSDTCSEVSPQLGASQFYPEKLEVLEKQDNLSEIQSAQDLVVRNHKMANASVDIDMIYSWPWSEEFPLTDDSDYTNEYSNVSWQGVDFHISPMKTSTVWPRIRMESLDSPYKPVNSTCIEQFSIEAEFASRWLGRKCYFKD